MTELQGIPGGDRRKDHITRSRIDEIIAQLEVIQDGAQRFHEQVRWILAGIAVTLFACLGIIGFLVDKNAGANTSICKQVQVINSNLEATVQRQQKALNTPGSPTYDFYHSQHPSQLAFATKEINQELTTFKPKNC